MRSALDGWLLPFIFCFSIKVCCSQNAPLKVFISADMEGLAGVVAEQQVGRGGRDYPIFRSEYLNEVNAAIAASLGSGATEVVVTDGHGAGIALRPDELDPRAVLITGSPKPHGMMQGLDESFAAVIFIGYHARGSTPNAIIAHTYSYALRVVRLNGQEVGEYGLNAAYAGFYGVPVVFGAGDRAFVEQAKQFIPGILTTEVKEPFGSGSAMTLSPASAARQITDGVKAALARRTESKALKFNEPVTIEFELASTAQADYAMLIPGMERTGASAVRYVAPNIGVAYQVSYLVERVAGE
jgi:D-amino peptidase